MSVLFRGTSFKFDVKNKIDKRMKSVADMIISPLYVKFITRKISTNKIKNFTEIINLRAYLSCQYDKKQYSFNIHCKYEK